MAVFKPINNGDVGIVGFRLRWALAPDQMLIVPQTTETQLGDWQPTQRDYPRFLGNHYWAQVDGVRLETDWQQKPPQELWRKSIGAGWSGFAIVGNYTVTQEQRGEQELVSCYDIRTGEIVWTHADQVRFDPSGGGALGGVGPRATPTIYQGRVVTFGATGLLNCLDARTGKLLWSHDTQQEYGTDNPLWGRSNSPLIVPREQGDWVAVSIGATQGHSLVAFDLATGEEVWANGTHRASYASPVLATLAGIEQIIVIEEEFVTSYRATDGAVLWEFPWSGNSDANASVSQPVPLPGDRVFLSKGYGVGAALLQIKKPSASELEVEPLWSPPIKPVMKTKMGNVVVHEGYVYGLDGGNLQCIELKTGQSQWKKRRRPAIGHGQLLLINNVILILTEMGELVLVAADPDRYEELAATGVFPEEQITWNNPAFSPPYLLVRNSQEVACYKLEVKKAEENSSM